MKHFSAALMLMFCMNARAVNAHEGVDCRSLEDNSCWHAINNSSQAIDVRCDGYGRRKLFAVSSLANDQLYAYQYCQNWADGMGYFEPGVRIRCAIASHDGRSASINFSLGGYGDRVAIQSDDDEVTVTVRAFWSDAVQVKRAPWSQ